MINTISLSRFLPGDRRSTLFSETPAGVQLWQQCVDAFSQLSDGYFHTLKKAEMIETVRVMKKNSERFKTKEMT